MSEARIASWNPYKWVGNTCSTTGKYYMINDPNATTLFSIPHSTSSTKMRAHWIPPCNDEWTTISESSSGTDRTYITTRKATLGDPGSCELLKKSTNSESINSTHNKTGDTPTIDRIVGSEGGTWSCPMTSPNDISVQKSVMSLCTDGLSSGDASLKNNTKKLWIPQGTPNIDLSQTGWTDKCSTSNGADGKCGIDNLGGCIPGPFSSGCYRKEDGMIPPMANGKRVTSIDAVCYNYMSDSNIQPDFKEALATYAINKFIQGGGDIKSSNPLDINFINNVSRFIPKYSNNTNTMNALKGICKNVSRSDINQARSILGSNTTSTASVAQNIASLCPYYMDDSQYSYPSLPFPRECDPLCNFADVKMKNPCVDTKCILQNTNINIDNSTCGTIAIDQLCGKGKCTPNNKCQCFINDLNVFQTNSNCKVALNSACDTCFAHPSKDNDIKSAIQIDCNTLLPLTPTPNPSGGGNTPTPTPTPGGDTPNKSFFSQYKIFIITSIVVFILLILVLLFV